MNHGAPQWKVRPHGSLKQVDNNILTVTGTIRMPFAFPRRMTVVRLRDGRLVVFSAIALDEDEMATLENYGVPAFLIVPNDHHRLDARMWKERYPSMQVIAPKRARHKVAEIVPVDTTEPKFGDPNVQFVEVPGTDGHEAALVVGTPYGTTLVLNDLVGNMRPQSGLLGWWLRLLGFCRQEGAHSRGGQDDDDQGCAGTEGATAAVGRHRLAEAGAGVAWRTHR